MGKSIPIDPPRSKRRSACASGATAASYTNATSYLLILGGWRNTKHVLARLDEHGEDRLELDVEPNSDDERARPVSAGQPYRFSVVRRDGRTLSWSVNASSTPPPNA